VDLTSPLGWYSKIILENAKMFACKHPRQKAHQKNDKGKKRRVRAVEREGLSLALPHHLLSYRFGGFRGGRKL